MLRVFQQACTTGCRNSSVDSAVGFGLATYIYLSRAGSKKICPKNKVSIVQFILQSVVVCINGLNVTFRARWFHRVFPTERRDCDCPGFPPPLGSRRLRSRNCLHLTSIPLSFNKPASGRKYQIIYIATRRRLLVIDGKCRVHL